MEISQYIPIIKVLSQLKYTYYSVDQYPESFCSHSYPGIKNVYRSHDPVPITLYLFMYLIPMDVFTFIGV